MNMLKRLLNSVSNVWNTQAKERNVFTLQQGAGVHTLVTLEGSQLHFHTNAYHETLPIKQSILIEDLTIAELITVIENVGYRVTILPGGNALLQENAVILMPMRNMPLTAAGYDVQAFTSNVWRMLYPVARLLELVEGDAELAMQQMYLRSSKGQWLDYWASFFNVKRFIGETDIALVKRIILLIVNPKTNNRSLEELLALTLGLDTDIHDVRPGVFEIRIEAGTVTDPEATDALLRRIKAGGVYYFYNYYKQYMEDYNSYLMDTTGLPKSEMDGGRPFAETGMDFVEPPYRIPSPTKEGGFTLNSPMDTMNDGESILGFAYSGALEVTVSLDYMLQEHVLWKAVADTLVPFVLSYEAREHVQSIEDLGITGTTLALTETRFDSKPTQEATNTKITSEVLFNENPFYVKVQAALENLLEYIMSERVPASTEQEPIHTAEAILLENFSPVDAERTGSSEAAYMDNVPQPRAVESLLPELLASERMPLSTEYPSETSLHLLEPLFPQPSYGQKQEIGFTLNKHDDVLNDARKHLDGIRGKNDFESSSEVQFREVSIRAKLQDELLSMSSVEDGVGLGFAGKEQVQKPEPLWATATDMQATEDRYLPKVSVPKKGFTLNYRADTLNRISSRLRGEFFVILDYGHSASSDVQFSEETLRTKVQEEILNFMPQYMGYEVVVPIYEASTTDMQMAFVENASTRRGEAIQMTMLDAQGQVVKVLN